MLEGDPERHLHGLRPQVLGSRFQVLWGSGTVSSLKPET
jgi:hypothetical protein